MTAWYVLWQALILMGWQIIEQRSLKLLRDDMVLDDPMLDQTHDEFLKLLYKLKNTSFEVILPVLDELITHIESHFSLEESWMARMSFPAAGVILMNIIKLLV